MNQIRLKRLIPAFLVLFLACSPYKPNSTEGDRPLGVIMDITDRDTFEPALMEALARPLDTPQPEPQFRLEFGNVDSLDKYSTWQNVLLLGTLDSGDSVSKLIRKMLKGEVFEGVEQGEYMIFRKLDLWARPQTVVFLVAASKQELSRWLAKNGDDLFRTFSEIRDQRTMKQMFSMMEQKELEDSLRQAFGWSIRIQHDYRLVTVSKSPSYVRLRRILPDRILTIAWRIGSQEEVVADTLVAWKNRLGAGFADPVRLNEKYLTSFETTINGLPAVGIYGLWETISSLGGGPSITYLLYSDGTLYLLDGQVFAPDREKEPFLRQLRLICNTFRPSPE